MKKYHIKPGDKYGRLTAVKLAHIGDHNRSYFLFKCECGKEKIILGSGVKSGNTKSCGCLATEVKKATRLPNDAAVINHIILQYKRHAKNRDIKFLLSRKMVDLLIRQPCHYCGVTGGNLKKTKNLKEGFKHNGIDRINSSKPYKKGNVVPCCGTCNRAKRDMPRDVFIQWAKRITVHQDAMASQWGKLSNGL